MNTRFSRVVLTSLVLFVLVSVACTPKASPSPSTPVPTGQSPVAAPAPATKATTEEDAWAKVVAAARKEGVVTIYSTGFVADIGKRISEDFGKQYGIRVEILSGNGRTLMERILLEQTMKSQVADIFNIGGAGSTSDLVLKGGADKVANELPVLRDRSVFKVDPVYSPGGEILVWLIAYSTIVVNSNLVKPENDPKSYKDLLSPRWKGQMLAPDPRTTGGASPFFYIPRYHKVLDLDYYKQIAKQDVKEFGGNPREAIRIVARGEFAAYLGGSTDTAAPIIAEGAPLKWAALEEGATVHLGNTLVVKGGPHPNAARLFTNWLLSPEGQKSYAESATSTPVRKDVPDAITPKGRVQSNIKPLPRSWEFEEWAIKDQAAKTMEQAFGKK
ncbi:MAG: ABC transporter substrate-binding protein [Chloroflexi bacterium]|nr:ABC transporter substrate-binding protein [Chloroflexota bacterium]